MDRPRITPTKAHIIEAVRKLDLEQATELLTARPSLVTVTDRQGRNLLHLASAASCPQLGVPEDAAADMVRFLLDRGLDIESTVMLGEDPCPPLWFAVAHGKNPTVVKLLIARGATPTGLFAAGWSEDVELLDLLVHAGVTIDEVVRGGTPFMLCWVGRRFVGAEHLVLHGADVNFQDPQGKTALHHGVEKGFDSARLTFLVRHGASPDIADHDGVTPRQRAGRKRDRRFLAALDQPRGS